jgi:hypothetical protein
LRHVLVAVEFDCELAARMSEIHDVRTDRMLPSKTMIGAQFAQPPP